MRSFLRLAPLSVVALAFLSASASAEIAQAESIEWVAVDSDRIVVGRVVEVRLAPGLGGKPYEVATVAVSRTLKGEHADRATFVLRNYNPPIAAGWMADGVPMLFFLVTGERARKNDPTLPPDQDWVLRDDHNQHCAVLLGPTGRTWTHTIPCLTRKYDVLTDPVAIVEYVSGIRRVAQDREPRSETVTVPGGTPVARKLYSGSMVELIVPAEGEADVSSEYPSTIPLRKLTESSRRVLCLAALGCLLAVAVAVLWARWRGHLRSRSPGQTPS